MARKRGLTVSQALMALRHYLRQRLLECWLPQNGEVFKEHLQQKRYWFGPQLANMTK